MRPAFYASVRSPLPSLPFTPFRGAFCIPNALPGIPYGDGRRIWTPAFGCYSDSWQDRIILELQKRKYTWCIVQLSGRPYGNDYPELAVDPQRVVRDLTRLRASGIRTIVAFRDNVGTDCNYLKPVAAVTQDLVDCVMGIFESNAVFNWDASKVLSVLGQQHELWPHAINAFHSSSQDNGGYGFGERDFWTQAHWIAHVGVYFLQQSAWNHTIQSTVDRAFDFIYRLQAGNNGWPKLPYGVVLAEETTSMTYRGWTEQMGTNVMDHLMMNAPIRPKGYLDGGTLTP